MTTSYQLHHRQLLETLVTALQQQPPFLQGSNSTEDSEFIQRATELLKFSPGTPDYLYEGQWLICRIVAGYPHITPLVPRDLFWFFGGDCLHFMPDEEIQKYQTLDERRAAAEDSDQPFNYAEERARLFGLH
ncbi:dehydrogenase [Exilibacterium tricleocarpae]|uniref:Dehydrogenase n=1 Tax=Exilibacterium tricleocarpae TaxID=2591008 RepID=A0A545SMW4_9GAMM|nr:PA2817 family protein [Exilibacterium tricleocarpae]TQV66297.1 dehydrogenase [Exilibacterium tricleocarpae]